ncbi:MAG: ATP-grasp domain-containing protein, partial [Candidatus Limnocylindria bacterium]
MKLCFMVARRVPPVPSPLLVDVFARLERRGCAIAAVIAEETLARPDRLAVEHDLYVLKSHTELTLSLAGVLDAQGARTLNPFASCVATQDKLVASRRLRAAGVPVPRSWATGDPEVLRSLVEIGPLILKPHRGHRGVGVRVVRDARELSALPRADGVVLAQDYVPGPGEDLKVYVIGNEVFAVRKPFSPTSFAVPGRRCEVDPEVRDIALACGRALGLGLYGLDVIESPQGPVVVDVNYFPGYKGLEGVAPLVADYIEGYARERRALRLPPLGAAADRPR